MRMIRIAALGGLLTVATAGNAAEVESRAAELVQGCRVLAAIDDGTADAKYGASDLRSAISAGYCSGYINGFIGGYTYGAHDAARKRVCIPAGVTTPQIARVLVQRLDEKPQFEHVAQLPFVIGVLAATWPCAES